MVVTLEPMLSVILAIIIGTLLAIVYSMRILVILERRIARVDENIAKIVNRVEREELAIERRMTKKHK